jgi:hypothetical protein
MASLPFFSFRFLPGKNLRIQPAGIPAGQNNPVPCLALKVQVRNLSPGRRPDERHTKGGLQVEAVPKHQFWNSLSGYYLFPAVFIFSHNTASG